MSLRRLHGAIGMLPSASRGGIYAALSRCTAVPQTSPGRASLPMAIINSVAMMLQYALHQPQAASAIEAAVERVLDQGYRTADILGPGGTRVGTTQMGEMICSALREAAAAPQR